MLGKPDSPPKIAIDFTPLYRQQTVFIPVLNRRTDTHAHKPFSCGSRHPLARQLEQAIHTVTAQQGSNSRGLLKSHYCTSLVK